ncbi:MAG TPA: mycothiol system anti-sigma-R factor [Cellulomonas sp.]
MTGWERTDGAAVADEAGAPALAQVAGGCGPDCEQALGRLFTYLDSELETADAAEVRAHIEDCRPCLDELAVETMLKNLVRRCCQEEAPADLRVRIRAQLSTLRIVRPQP